MKYEHHYKSKLLNSTGSHSLQDDFELLLDEAYRFMGWEMNKDSIRTELKVLAILESKDYHK
jgi:hypothetical protein